MPTIPTSGSGGAAIVSSGTIASDRIRVFREDEIFQLEPYEIPLLALLQRIGMEEVPNPTFEWLERDRTQRSALTADVEHTWADAGDLGDDGYPARYSCAVTLLNSVEAACFKVNHMVYCVTGQASSTDTNWRALVTKVDGGVITLSYIEDKSSKTDITIAAPAAIAAKSELLIIGSAYEEFSGQPEAFSIQPTTEFNYVQHFRDTWGISDYAETLDVYGDPEFAEQAEEAIGLHRLDVERTAWFGVRNVSSATSNQPRYYTSGVMARLATNVFESAETLANWSYGDLVDDSAQLFEYSPGTTKFAFCGQDVLSRVSRPSWQGTGGGGAPTEYTNVQNNRDLLSEMFGMKITRLMLPHGVLALIPHYEVFKSRIPLAADSVEEHLADQLVALDLDLVRGVTLRGKGIGILEENIQSPGTHGRVDGVYSYFGTKLRHEKRHAKWRFQS